MILLAARLLAPSQRRIAIFGGSCAATSLRLLRTAFPVAFLQLPLIKLVGGALLSWVAAQLIIPEEGGEDVAAGEGRFAVALAFTPASAQF